MINRTVKSPVVWLKNNNDIEVEVGKFSVFSLSVPDDPQGSKTVHTNFMDYFTSQHLICPSREINK